MKKSRISIFLFILIVIACLCSGIFISSWGGHIWFSHITTLSFPSLASKFIALLTACALIAVVGSIIICKTAKQPLIPQMSILWKILILSTLFMLIYNQYIFPYKHLITTTIFSTAAAILLSYAVMRRFFFVLWIPILSVALIQIWCFHSFGSTLNAFMLQETMRANSTEVGNFLTWQNVTFVLACLFATIFLLWLTYRSLRNTSTPTLLFTGSTALLLYCLSSFCISPHLFQIASFWPASEARNIASLFSEAQEQEAAILQSINNLPSPAQKPSSLSTVQPNQGVVCILHIGESVRADRLGINGWKNNTTPRLAARPELINYRNCISSAPSTCSAILTILTNATWDVQKSTIPNSRPTAGSVLDLFTANGFTGAAFVHAVNVAPRGKRSMVAKSFNHTFDRLFYTLTSTISHNEFIHHLSMEQSDQIIRYCKNNKNDNLILFVNNMGSHGPFTDYDHKKPTFTPSNHDAFYTNASLHAEAVSNAYDNTIAYTDEFIGRICDSLQGRPFVYIYISDHGEFLGENGLWSRAALKSYSEYPKTQAAIVPLVFAFSPEFENIHPHITQALQQLRLNSKQTISQAHLFHTLIGLFGIKTEYHTPELDLTSPHAKPHTGPMPEKLL